MKILSQDKITLVEYIDKYQTLLREIGDCIEDWPTNPRYISEKELTWLTFHFYPAIYNSLELMQVTFIKQIFENAGKVINSLCDDNSYDKYLKDNKAKNSDIAALMDAISITEKILDEIIPERNKKIEKSQTDSRSGSGNKTKPSNNIKHRRKTPPQILKETRERQAVKELAKNPNITCRELGKILGCNASTVSRLKAWEKKEVLNGVPSNGFIERNEDGETSIEAIETDK